MAVAMASDIHSRVSPSRIQRFALTDSPRTARLPT
jgi:hypothetical protein